MSVSRRVLFSAACIAARVEELAAQLADLSDPPERLVPVLTGAFVFAADLARVLARKGLDLPIDWLWLSSYAMARSQGSVVVRAAPDCEVRNAHLLLIDGVLDSGRTLATAIELLTARGARKITTAVVVDKRLAQARLRADYACFCGVDAFIAGYGMDDQGLARGQADIIAL